MDLLAIDDVGVAVADRPCLHPGQIGSGIGLAEQLPGTPLATEDRCQKSLLLLLRAPYENACPAETTTRIVVRRQVQTIAVEFFFENHDKINAQVATPILLGIRGVEPSFG